MTAWWCEQAWLPDGVAAGVRVEAADDGTVALVELDADPAGATRLAGVVLPGFANVHSHAFHRALRGRTHAGKGTFWTWREQMYQVAARLDPDSYLSLATAVYAEMALAGITCVGEFHYVHHRPGGRPYDDPLAMSDALREAARRAGIRLTILDTCYLAGGIGKPLAAEQLRFGDADVHAWAQRLHKLANDAGTRVGAAVHSVRAVPADVLPIVVEAARGLPLHVHLSEQKAENAASLQHYGVTPTRLLHEHGVLGPLTTAVHATHLTGQDIPLLAATRTNVCACPTTERDLADGIGPMRALHAVAASISLGTDQHAVIDMFEEARGLEMDQRLVSGQRGAYTPSELVDAMTWRGHVSVGWPGAGRIAVGAPCDLVAVRLDTVRSAGVDPAQVAYAAAAADVDTVVVSGREVVRDGAHVLGDVGAMLSTSIRSLWEGA